MYLRNFLLPILTKGFVELWDGGGPAASCALSTVPVLCYLKNSVQKEAGSLRGTAAPACLILANDFPKGFCNVEVRAGPAEDRNWREARSPKWKQSSFLSPQLSQWEQMITAGKGIHPVL